MSIVDEERVGVGSGRFWFGEEVSIRVYFFLVDDSSFNRQNKSPNIWIKDMYATD